MTASGADPRCPECGEPVGAAAIYCLHCKVDLREPPDDGADVTDADDVSWDAVEEDATGGRRRLVPEGALDDSLTVLVAVVAGLLVGVLALVVLALVTQHWTSLVLAPLAWLAVTAHLARRRSAREALRLGAYAVALGLVSVPAVAFSDALKGGDFAGRVVLFLVGEVVLGGPALVLALVGYRLGRPASIERR